VTDRWSLLDAIRDRWAAATPGPWHWVGYVRPHDLTLQTVGRGGLYVMQFRRKGMQSGEPWFQDPPRNRVAPASEFYKTDHAGRILDIDRPDARAIAAAPQDIADLLEEVGRLREALEAINLVPADTADEPLDLLQEHWAVAGAALAGRPLPT
jgi:hypothetical protein